MTIIQPEFASTILTGCWYYQFHLLLSSSQINSDWTYLWSLLQGLFRPASSLSALAPTSHSTLWSALQECWLFSSAPLVSVILHLFSPASKPFVCFIWVQHEDSQSWYWKSFWISYTTLKYLQLFSFQGTANITLDRFWTELKKFDSCILSNGILCL